MKRGLEIVSGIGVLITALLSSAAVFRMIQYYQHISNVPLISLISLSITGFAAFLSFIGAYILLSWAGKSR